MVGPDHLSNAVGLNSAVFNCGRIIGPAAAGVLIGIVGIAPAFLVNGFSYLAVIAGLLLMRPGELFRNKPVERSDGQVRDGLRYAWATPTLRSTLLLMSVVATLGLNFRVTLPLLARFTFDGGPDLYGLLASMVAAGSVVGALATASRSRPTRSMLLWSVTVFGVASLLAAVAASPLIEAIVLVPLGFSSIAWMATANSTVQLGSAPEMRGRVMSIYGLLFLGSAPLGAMLVGWLSEHYGPRSSLVLGGVSSLAAVAVAALADRRARRRRTAPSASPQAAAALAGSDGSDEAA
jgi:predicted MFS family arabinose efflux permease